MQPQNMDSTKFQVPFFKINWLLHNFNLSHCTTVHKYQLKDYKQELPSLSFSFFINVFSGVASMKQVKQFS